jgi:outer membrane protein assembly factor BamB
VYAVDAATGALRWKQAVAPTTGFCIGNGRPISAWPVRGGPVVADGRVYCAAGVFPEQVVYLAALQVADGAVAWRCEVPYAISGGLLVDGELLWAPTHRTAPAQFKRADGAPLVPKPPILLSRGAAQLWSVDGLTTWGPDEGGIIYLRVDADVAAVAAEIPKGATKKQTIPTVLGRLTALDGWAAVTGPEHFFLVQDDRVLAVRLPAFREALRGRMKPRIPVYSKLGGLQGDEDAEFRQRLEQSAAWSKELPLADQYRSAIVANGQLILGGKNTVAAFDAATGAPAWSAPVEGEARALAAEAGAVCASTDTGRIYCFRANAGAPVNHEPVLTNPWPANDASAAVAAKAIAEVGRKKGVAVVLGGDGRLAAALARQSEFFVILFAPDAAQAAAARQNLVAAGLYGARVVVRLATAQTLAAYPAGVANLVVTDGAAPFEPAVVERLVQPYSGVALRDGKVARRAAWPGAGQWPTANGTLANTMNTGETGVPADSSDLRLQWFGAPYAADTADRHSVPLAPLFQNGILFSADNTNTLTGIDAYNGTILWKTTMPKRRLASHNASPMACAADGRHLFTLNAGECQMLDAVTGQKVATFGEVAAGCDWGYVGNEGNFLIGTSQDKGVAEYATGKGKGQVTASTQFWSSQPSVSRDLFVIDLAARRKLWTHTGGRIVNSTITVADGRVYFTESQSPAAMSDKTGMVKMTELVRQAEIVALDLATGQVLWRQPVTRQPDQPMQWLMYLTVADGKLLATRTYFVGDTRGYDFEAFDAATGQSLWTRWWPAQYTGMAFGLAYGKNSLSSRPIVVGNTFYLRSNLVDNTHGAVAGFDLRTGEPVGEPIRAGTHDAGCSVAIGSAHALYYRDYIHVAFDLAKSETYPLTGVTRPACWPDTLPVGGLIVAPEGSAYCSCGFAYQMSFALAPKETR